MPRHNIQRGGGAGFDDRQQRGANAVAAHDVLLHREPVAHMRHVPDIDHVAVDLLERNVVQFLDGGRAAVQLHGVLGAADLLRPGGQDQVFRADGVDHVAGGKSLPVQGREVNIHHDLAGFAAVGIGHGGPLHRGQPDAQKIHRPGR